MALTSSQYREIMRDYETIRDKNRRLTEERKEQIFREIPEYLELHDSVGSYAASEVHRLLSDDTLSPASPAENPIAQIASKRRALLRGAGYPEDYLDPIYTCKQCQDTGYIADSHGLKTKCKCFKDRELAFLYEQSNLQGVLASDNFSRLSFEYCSGQDLEHLKGAVRISMDFIKSFPDDCGNLLFYGTVGTGKSFLSGCIANELLERGFSVVYFSAISLFASLSRYSFETNTKETLYNFSKDLYNYDLVIIDDLGTEVLSSFVTSQLFSLLNEREMRKKATIISTNLNLGELKERYSDRVFSRLTKSFTICMLSGPDVRMCQKLRS